MDTQHSKLIVEEQLMKGLRPFFGPSESTVQRFSPSASPAEAARIGTQRHSISTGHDTRIHSTEYDVAFNFVNCKHHGPGASETLAWN